MASNNGSIPAITGQIDTSNAFHIFPEPLRPFKGSILAYACSFCSTFIGFPLDTVKTRLQAHKEFRGVFDCIRKTYAKEGVNGFYRGIYAPLFSSAFTKSANVALFTKIKPWTYDTLYAGSTGTPAHPFIRNIPVCFASGAMTAVTISFFACPFEFIKVYAQLEKLVHTPSMVNATASASTGDIVRLIVKHEGLGGLYSGLRYHMGRDALFSATYYSVYESTKWSMNALINLDPAKSSPISILMGGGMAGIVASAVMFPIDSAKSLFQKDIIANILRKEHGLEPLPLNKRPILSFDRRLYKGVGITCTRSFLVSMAFFNIYEIAMKYLA
ncbi:integral membrane ornithine transporter of mitochondria [Suhomyces tanzawaensis NRRL Y-17324]|uniref:Mitochondrial thiamine pyrophosphate carrier 1 n=1 Tax=Suhomyces tanzawaensis NRRL Y-17324 TaxID=984487 RepID=A0A1E4SRK5_9ASCO|nr:integral membrane ornithine transporter of mitochondria [Suhomyces tanzawaensis NRRL Y-17324]ODV82135.1 integral membrane ornithine transporter of mitochondria [Suhomyces tanzawaensis NRRL Y-17324]